MNVHCPYIHHYYGSVFLVAQDLPPLYSPSQQPLTILMENITDTQDNVLEYHHYYGYAPVIVTSPLCCYYNHQYTESFPSLPVNRTPQSSPPDPQSGTWAEGFTMQGELRWGKLERVFGLSRELPDFVKEDLRRVYGTYPSTGVRISYHRGEFVVRGDPRVGQQEYRVEKKVIRKVESPCGGDIVSEVIRPEKKNRMKGK